MGIQYMESSLKLKCKPFLILEETRAKISEQLI